MFKQLREQMGVDMSKYVHKPRPSKRSKRKKEKLTPEQYADRRHDHAMIERAAILSIADIGGGLYQVWGGEEPHLVTHTDGWVTCDCRGWGNARNHVCSHVMKYRLTFGDLKK